MSPEARAAAGTPIGTTAAAAAVTSPTTGRLVRSPDPDEDQRDRKDSYNTAIRRSAENVLDSARTDAAAAAAAPEAEEEDRGRTDSYSMAVRPRFGSLSGRPAPGRTSATAADMSEPFVGGVVGLDAIKDADESAEAAAESGGAQFVQHRRQALFARRYWIWGWLAAFAVVQISAAFLLPASYQVHVFILELAIGVGLVLTRNVIAVLQPPLLTLLGALNGLVALAAMQLIGPGLYASYDYLAFIACCAAAIDLAGGAWLTARLMVLLPEAPQ